MKKHLRFLLGNIMGFFIFHLALKKKNQISKNQIVSLYFHNPSPELFEKCIKYLVKRSYTFVSSDTIEQLLINKETIDKKLAIISFDDGWRDNLKLLPVIEKYQVYITLFIATEPIISGNFWWEYGELMSKIEKNNPLSIDGLKRISNEARLKIISEIKSKIVLERSAMTLEELCAFSNNKYITIGSHTINHPITIMCGEEELFEEYSGSKKILEEWLNKEIKYFAYPNGDYNSRDLTLLEKSGYKMAYTIIPESINHRVHKYEIPRCTIDDDKGYFENRAKMFGIWQSLRTKMSKVRT